MCSAQDVCVAAAVTSLGLLPAAKKKKKKKKEIDTGESTCSGWSSADDFHVALASSEPEPEPPSRQSGAATAGDNISMAADMEPSE